MGEGPGNGIGIGRARLRWRGRYTAILAAGVLVGGTAAGVSVASASTSNANTVNSVPVPAKAPASEYRIVAPTSTPIKHLVVIFDENESFDHYFGTYPDAANTDGTPFHAKPGTPKVNGLTPSLLNHNPNSYNPERLTPAAGADLRPEPRLHGGAGSVQRRQDGHVRPGHPAGPVHR